MEISPDPVEGAKAGTAVSLTATPDVTEGTTYLWEGTNGSFDANNTATVQFTPTAQGACTAKVTATNGEKVVTDEISFEAGASE